MKKKNNVNYKALICFAGIGIACATVWMIPLVIINPSIWVYLLVWAVTFVVSFGALAFNYGAGER